MALAVEQARWPPLALLSRKQGPAKNSLQAGSYSRETFCIRLKQTKKKHTHRDFSSKRRVRQCWKTAGSWMPERGTEQGSLACPVVRVRRLLCLLHRPVGSLPPAPTSGASKSRPDKCISQDKRSYLISTTSGGLVQGPGPRAPFSCLRSLCP